MFKVRLLGTVGTLAVLAPFATTSVWAQSVVPKDAAQPVPDDAASQQTSIADIVVTGSRIQNPGATAPTPLTVLDATKMRQTAPSTVDDIIGQLPAFRATSGPTQNTRTTASLSAGQSLANLRGLGAQRTLVLIDGRRPVPTNPQGTTSTSIIPTGLIQRLDVVTGGASAAYGSDAVAGVANFKLIDRLDHIQGQVIGGISDHGDNKEFGANIAFGVNALGDRLHIVAGADYNKNYGVGNIYSRKWSAVEPGNSGNPIAFGASRPAGTPAFGFANGVEYAAQTVGSIITGATTTAGRPSTALNLLAFNPDGSTYTLARGPVYGNLMTNSSSNPVATPLAQWNLKQPLEQFSGLIHTTAELGGDTTAFLDIGYARSNVFAYSQYHQAQSITILANNPYIPASLQSALAANNIASFNIGRVDTEWLGSTIDNTLSTLQVATGAKGTVFGRIKWDASYSYGRSVLDSNLYGTREANQMAAAYAVRDTSGNIVCGPVASNPNFAASRLTNSIQPGNVQPGCAPFNPFGAGNASQQTRDYISGVQSTRVAMVRQVVAANLSAPLFALPGGDLAIAAGGEMRWDTLDQRADALQEAGIYSNGNNKSYSGRNEVKEVYAEVEIPLLKNLFAIHSLGLNAAIRRTDYQVSGAVTTWKVGGTWEPLEGLRFRATRSRDIRAPSLSELFLVGGIGANGSFFNPFNGQSARLPTQTVGNPSLRPEKADTFSVGMSYEGRNALRGLHVSVDYYKIKVNDVIASVQSTDIIQRCYQGVTQYCSAITFDNSTFGIANVLIQPFNQARLVTDGIDFEFGYRRNLSTIGLAGDVDLTVYATYLNSLKSTDFAGPGGATLDYAGYQAGSPKWVISTYLNYKLNPIEIGLQMRAFTKIRYSPLYVGPGEAGYDPALSNSINKNTFSGQALFNLNLAYDFELGGRKAQIFTNISNLFNTTPPQYALAAINLGGNPYDYVGRTYKLGVRFGL